MTHHFRPADAALLLVDYQVGTLQLASTTPAYEALRNAIVLAKAAKVLGIPIVLTASQEDRVQGPIHDGFSRVVPRSTNVAYCAAG